MSQALSLFRQAVSNKLIQYVFSRYFIYLIQFINSLLLAVNLGPYYLGIWGFVTLVIQFFLQINFGISHSANALISLKKEESYVFQVFNTSLNILILVSLLIAFLFLSNSIFDIGIGSQYNFSSFALIVCLIVILNYFIGLFTNLFRVYNQLFEITVSQFLFPLFILLGNLLFKGEELIRYLVISNLFVFISTLLLFIWKCPIKIKLTFSKLFVKEIIKRGVFLFIYNSSFYLIIISTRYFISLYYPVKEFGYFTFSFTMANTILLILESFSFIIFPKTINLFGKANSEESSKLLTKLRNDYITFSHGLVHLAVLLFPIFLYFIPLYENTIDSLRTISLTLLIYTNCFGYSSFLIAKSKEKKLSFISLASLCLNILLAFMLVKFFKVDFSSVIISTTFSYLFFLFGITYYGCKMINEEISVKNIVLAAFPICLLIPFIFSFFLIYTGASNFLFLLPLLIFLIINFNKLKNIYLTIRKLMARPDVINI